MTNIHRERLLFISFVQIHAISNISSCFQGSVSFEYQPLHARQSTARLTLHSAELGYFHYDLALVALPSPPEKTIHFRAPLGRSQVELVKFINYSHVKTEYSCSVRTTLGFFNHCFQLALTNVIYILDVYLHHRCLYNAVTCDRRP